MKAKGNGDGCGCGRGRGYGDGYICAGVVINDVESLHIYHETINYKE
jgi:hypothetical protein